MSSIPDPDRLYNLAEELEARWPALRGRALRAAGLLSAGHVLGPAPTSTYLASIGSQSDAGRVYYVRLIHPAGSVLPGRRVLTCTCPDFRERSAPKIGRRYQPYCKHILAVSLAHELDLPLPAYDPLGDALQEVEG